MSQNSRPKPKQVGPKIGGIILSRKMGQEVWINLGMIKLQVIRVTHSQVVFRIQAPDEIRIDRREHLDELVARGDLNPEVLKRR